MKLYQLLLSVGIMVSLSEAAKAYTDQTDFMHPWQYKAAHLNLDSKMKKQFSSALENECGRVKFLGNEVVCEDKSSCKRYELLDVKPKHCVKWVYQERWKFNPFVISSLEQRIVSSSTDAGSKKSYRKKSYQFTAQDYMRNTFTFSVNSEKAASRLGEAISTARSALYQAPN